jgi:hypothetical protein
MPETADATEWDGSEWDGSECSFLFPTVDSSGESTKESLT